MPSYVLWDIDNTLLYTGGAGSLGMRRAFNDLYGVDDAFGRVEFSGRTDTAIFADAAHACGIEPERMGGELVRFLDAYIPHLQMALQEVEGKLMPGIGKLLEALDARDDVVMGLGTGNFRRGGEMKLVHYGIDRYFPGFVGGFGEDSPSRDEVVRLAIERLTEGRANGDRVVVVGDTPHDIAAAHANGAFAFGVATGRNPVDELLACGADVALASLDDVDRVVSIIVHATA
ncbi:MAG: HAD family hydrolase [Dehalococcoidia bacterium]